MNRLPPVAAPAPSLQLSATPRTLALLAVLLFTLFAGFINSLNVEYDGANTTFLYTPQDLHADLVKTALSFPPYPRIDDSRWNPVYQEFYEHNSYGGIDSAQKGDLSNLHMPPLVMLMLLGCKRVILWSGPSLLIAGYYTLALGSVALLAMKFGENRRDALFLFVVLALSFPFLMILSRGNFGALFTSLPLIGLIYEVLVRRRWAIAALYLAIALNFRPNAAFFFPLFLVYGVRGFLKASLLSSAIALMIGLTSYLLTQHYYPGYDYAVSEKALQGYSRYAIAVREGSMNSLFGVLLPTLDLLHQSAPATNGLALACTGFCGALAALLAFFFWQGRIEPFAYAFGLSALYVIGTPIFASYHLFFLFAFILLWGKTAAPGDFIGWRLAMLLTTVLVLIPKNYATYYIVSPDSEFNPLCLLLVVALIVLHRRRGPSLAAAR